MEMLQRGVEQIHNDSCVGLALWEALMKRQEQGPSCSLNPGNALQLSSNSSSKIKVETQGGGLQALAKVPPDSLARVQKCCQNKGGSGMKEDLNGGKSIGEMFASSNPTPDSSKGNDGELFRARQLFLKDKRGRIN